MAKATSSSSTITIKLKSSFIGCPEKHKIICRSIGLKKINQTATVPDNPGFRGMVAKVPHLLVIVNQ